MAAADTDVAPDAYGVPGAFTLKGFLLLLRRALGLVWSAARRSAIALIALQTFGGLVLAAQLLLGRRLLDRLSADGTAHPTVSALMPLLLLLALSLVASGLVGVVTRNRELLVNELTTRHVMGRVIDAATSVPYEAFEDPEFHDRLRRARTVGITNVWTVVWSLASLLTATTGIAATGVVLGSIAPVLLLLVVFAFVPLAAVTLRNGRTQYQFSYGLTSTDRERDYLASCLIDKVAAKEVRLYGLTPHLRSTYDRLYDRRLFELRRMLSSVTRRSLVGTTASAVVTFAAVVALVAMSVDGRVSIAEATIAALALQQMSGRVRSINGAVGSLHQCSLFLADLVRFVDEAPVTAPATIDLTTNATSGELDRLEVKDLSFAYPGVPSVVLNDVSFTIGRGEVVALVGENGSGKTTLAKLLCGLYQPTSGVISWHGEGTRQAAAIFQDFVQYDLAARLNVAMGDPSRSDDRAAIVKAAELADADQFLRKLPEGYDTRLSRSYAGGVDLSVGQWQRVALARAFFADRPFLVLDEPTAALDARAEAELFASMRGLYKGRTVLLISHRFSSVMTADRILVLKQGRLIEQGTHSELITLGGHYAELFRLQASAYLDESQS